MDSSDKESQSISFSWKDNGRYTLRFEPDISYRLSRKCQTINETYAVPLQKVKVGEKLTAMTRKKVPLHYDNAPLHISRIVRKKLYK